MQLTRTGSVSIGARSLRLLFVAAAALTLVARSARAGGDAESPDRPSTEHAVAPDKSSSQNPAGPGLGDTATEHASFEMATYDDSDHVTVMTPSVAAGIENVDGASLEASYLVDVVSAASVDIVSTASRRWQEVRQAGTLTAQYKPRDFGVGVGGSISREPDYLSYGVFATVTKDFDEKNWSLFFGYGFGHDTIGRCGGLDDRCTPFSIFSRELLRASFNGGVNVVLDRLSVGSLVADVVVESGDQSKPYRYIPMFSPEVAPTVSKGATIDWVNANRLPEKPLEQLPLSRKRFALTAKYARRFGTTTFRLSERLYDDTWGLVASSSDVRWIFDLGKRFAVWPHVRFHTQRGVNFWKLAYVSGEGWDLPLYRTGDRELGPLYTVQGGLGAKWYFGPAAEPTRWAVELTGDGMYTAFLDDLFLSSRVAVLGALGMEGTF